MAATRAALDPQLQMLVDAASGLDLGGVGDVTTARRGVAMSIGMADGPPEDVASVVDLTVPTRAGSIAARAYRGAGAEAVPPILVWYHGGGWVIGDLETADGVCRRLANRTGALVVSVDYRLAPEHPVPAAADDSWDALEWVAAHADDLGGDVRRLAVGGDSAGGNLAALMAIRARDEGGPTLAYQLLVYPATDLTRSSPSHQEQALALFDPAAVAEWFHMYVGDADPGHPSISPASATDLSGVAPACVVTAGHDPLRDEGIAYAERLAASGVAVEHMHYPSMLHGFIQFVALTPSAMDATESFCVHVRRGLVNEED
jgi:acetyl esterase